MSQLEVCHVSMRMLYGTYEIRYSFRKYVNPLHMWVEFHVLRQQPVKLAWHGATQSEQRS